MKGNTVIGEIDFSTPKTLNEAYQLLADPQRKPLAGATDLIPRMRNSNLPINGLVDLNNLADLKYIRDEGEEIFIGALTTHAEISSSELLGLVAKSLVEASRSIGCPQTRNRGTIGGNIANASPAADTLPPLLTYGAFVHLGSKQGVRSIPLSTFLVGPGITNVESGEIILSVSFKKLAGYGMAFSKLGKRKGMAIAVASASAALKVDEFGKIIDARIALGSVSSTALRGFHVEEVLMGKSSGEKTFEEASKVVSKDISPISDIRASASYRTVVAASLIKQSLKIAESRL